MKKNFKLIIFIPLIVFLIVAAVVLANKWRTDSHYNKITIRGNFTIPEDDILKYLKLENDSVIDLKKVNLELIQDRILNHPEIKKVSVVKQPPKELIIEIVEKKPIAIINFYNKLMLVDRDFEIFSFKNSGMLYDLPVISGIDLKNDPENINSLKKSFELKTAIFLINLAYTNSKTLYSYISEICMNKRDMIIIYSNYRSIPFYFPRMDKGDTEKSYSDKLQFKLKCFGGFLEQILPDKSEKEIEYVDLRFEKQVIAKEKLNQYLSDGSQNEKTN
ncbi:MAG: hypothetical protein B6D43_09360 [Ignavibacteriales bacterium UTCHB1]|jgi:Cell division septal protein|nr:FtsQ-type POTRA domain-containing protein [Ignavibacteria bacterium]OQY76822.1 MAG: hypothetical protein B6D43_09360 [Ignavibacteriales bacterium UTCHB1]